ncbi:hypothetical protein GOV11_00085 [Candidatus Woesearchaeota archaeon]|nr:hypothetical protein [Candidatus Woesearchaeota archaeon]
MALNMTKRIPVSEKRWKQLGQMKQAGQSYDALLGELVQARNRLDLARRMDAAEKGKGEWFSLEDV